jgi:hypothetical protein
MKEESKKPKDEPKQVLDPQPGAYSDGHPLDEVHYLECKIILKGDRFTSVENFHDFSKIVHRTAEATDVGYSTEAFKGLRPQIREVLFVDTQDFRLYNNAFILRRRVDYVDGFAVGDASQAVLKELLGKAQPPFRKFILAFALAKLRLKPTRFSAET